MTLNEVCQRTGPKPEVREEEDLTAWFVEQISGVFKKHMVEPTPLLTILIGSIAAHLMYVYRIERWIEAATVPIHTWFDSPSPQIEFKVAAGQIETCMDLRFKAHAALRKCILDATAFVTEAGTPI